MPTLTSIGDRQPSLKEAQTIVGGYVQLLELPGGVQLLCDEDGISKELPLNDDATRLLIGTHYEGQRIFGDALILKGKARWD